MLIDAVWVTIAVRDWLRNEERVAQRIDLQTLRAMSLTAGPNVDGLT
jgi:hypothetical protein